MSEIHSGKVYSWYGSELSDAFWKPSWLSLDKDGYLKWHQTESGHLNGVAHLPAIYDKITLENIADYKIEEEKQVHKNSNFIDGSKLCPIVVALRFRVNNLEERISFGFDSKHELDEWMSTFVNFMNDSNAWSVGPLDSYIKNWKQIYKLHSTVSRHFDTEACCGVSDQMLDKILKRDTSTTRREQMTPKSPPGQAGPKGPKGPADDNTPSSQAGGIDTTDGTFSANDAIASSYL